MAVRMQEHTHHTRNGRTDLSAVAERAVVESHEIDWTTAKVIDTAVQYPHAKGQGGFTHRTEGVKYEQEFGQEPQRQLVSISDALS